MTRTHRTLSAHGTATLIQRTLLLSALAGGCALVAPGCSSDDPAPTSGADASAGGSDDGSGGGKSTGGGKATGGTATGTGGKATGGTAGATGKPDAEVPAEAGLPVLSGTALVAASDGKANVGEVVTIDLATGAIVARFEVADGDVAVSSSNGRAFALERNAGTVHILSATGTIAKTVHLRLGDGGVSYLNPHSPLVVPGGAKPKAYVPLNAANAIAIIDLDTGVQTGAISLAPFLDPSDHDGSAEPDSILYDAATKRAYFLLGRTDVLSGTAETSYTPACPPVPALIIAVDTVTDTLVDLNDAGGVGIELPLVAPGAWAHDEKNGRLYFAANGCSGKLGDGGFVRTHDGIASVDLGTRKTSILLAGASKDYLSDLLPVGDGSFGVVQAFGATINRFDPATPTSLGAAYVDVPDAVVAYGAGTWLGVRFGKFADGGVEQQIVRYDVGSQRVSRVAGFSWSHRFSFASVTVVK